MKKLVSSMTILGLVVLSAPIVRADNTNTSASTPDVASVASAASINGGAATISMSEGVTTPITVTAAVSDNNGCGNIGVVTINLYTTGATPGTPDSNISYTGTMAKVGTGDTCPTGAELHADYTKTFDVEYYANPGEWTATVTPAGAGATPSSDTSEISTLRALSVTATIAYGSLALGADTGITNQTTTVYNTGNIVIDTQVNSGAADTAMTCEGSTSIPVAQEKWGLTSVTYGSLTNALVGSASHPYAGTSIAKTTTGDPSSDAIYWGLGLPATGVSGACSGTVVFTAVEPVV